MRVRAPGSVVVLAFAVVVCVLGGSAAAPVAAQRTLAPQAWTAPEDPELRDAYEASLRARTARDFAAGIAAYRAMVERARTLHDELWEGRGLYGIGTAESNQLNFTAAQAPLEQAVAIFERLGDQYDIGVTCVRLGANADSNHKIDDAHGWYVRAIAAFDAIHDLPHRALAEYDDLRASSESPSDPRYPLVLADVRASGDRSLEAAFLHMWGDEYFNASDFDKAAERLTEAAALLEGSELDPDQLGTTYNSLGRLYRVHGQLQVALQYQLKALAIHEKLDNAYSYVQSLNAVAASYQFLGDLPKATAYFKRALAVAERGSAQSIVSFLRASYGDALVEKGDYAEGRALLAQALPDATAYFQAMRLDQIARADIRLEHFAQARDEASEAITHCEAGPRENCIFARLARAAAALGTGDIDAALADQTGALRLLETMHGSLAASDFMKQGFQAAWEPTYSLAIDLQMRRGQTRDALESAELGRSRALLDLLASRQASAVAAAPSAIAHAGVSGSLSSASVASPATASQLTEIAARLNSTLILYWVSDEHVYVWTVAGDGVIHSAVTPMSARKLATLVKAVTAFSTNADDPGRPVLTTRGSQAVPIVMTAQPEWRELYDALIQPIAPYLPAKTGARVTIVPHGALMAVPFAALRDRTGRYLVERYTIHEAPAGGLFAFTAQARKPEARSGNALLIADPTPTPRSAGESALPRLPGAAVEVDAIAKLMPGHATVLADTAAIEPRVVDAIAHHTLLHFATHAVVRDSNPSASFLALGRPADRSTSGELTPDKIYALKLDADLVVLSACRSGGGPPNGDGVAALARAFFYAGAPSVIVSVWDVADSPTNRLLPAFYLAWLDGADKASALRAAQLKLIADLRAGKVTVRTKLGDFVLPENPAFWAGFVLLGEAD